MKPQKDTWINDILHSVDGLQRAESSPFLYTRIQARLAATRQIAYVPVRWVWVGAASFTLLLLLNWQVIRRQATPAMSADDDLSAVVSAMYLYPANHQLYDVWSEPGY